jgi:hypothetical protein
MPVVRMMEMSAYQVIHMVAMRHCFVATPRPMGVPGFMRAAVVTGCALGGILSTHSDPVIINMTVVRMMQVSIVQVIGMAVMRNGGVAAIPAVDVGVALVFYARSSHYVLL